MKTMLTRWRKI